MTAEVYAQHTILIMERDAAIRRTLRDQLESQGQVVIEVDTPARVVDCCRDQEMPDLAVLSIHEDEANDYVLCRALLDLLPSLPILVITNLNTDENINRVFDSGAVDCIIAPYSETLLLQRIRQQLAMDDMRRALEYNQESLQLALEAGEIGIWDWDMVTDKAFFSREWLAMIGYKQGDIAPKGSAWYDLIHPDDVATVQAKLDDHIQNSALYEVQHRLKTKSGDWKWILARGRVVARDDDGTPIRMAGTHRDVHERVQMEAALQESENRYRMISETISDYAYSYIVCPDGSLKKDWSTAAFHEITGYTFEEMDADGWRRLIHPDDMHIGLGRFERLLQGIADVSEFRVVTKKGEVRWLRDHGHPVVDADTGKVVHIYGAAQDITQVKEDAQRLQQQAAELQERNEELDAFAHTVAHDLKNPVASMMGFASLIQNYHSRMTDEQILENVGAIVESGYQIKNIINSLLILAGVGKVEKPDMEPLDMHVIVDDSVRRLAAAIYETGAEINLPDDWPDAMGYGPWVEEIWMNYISNAIKYGGIPPVIHLGAEMTTDHVRFWVRDNGRGLTEEEQKIVFTPFTRLNQIKVEGHGLGLSVVERIAQKLNGTVGVKSTPGEGSEFSFTLPVVREN